MNDACARKGSLGCGGLIADGKRHLDKGGNDEYSQTRSCGQPQSDVQKALQNLGSKGQAVQRMKALETRLGQSAAEMDKATKRTAELGQTLVAAA